MRSMISMIALTVLLGLALSSDAATLLDDQLYYFNLSNALVDLDMAGGVYYGEIRLEVTAANNIRITVNPYTTEVADAYGNPISSPLTALENFGVQVFALNIGVTDDETEFVARYEIDLPDGWSYSYDSNVSEFGMFEFKYSGTGSTRQDPLEIVISPIGGADLTGYEFSSVAEFVEANAAGYCFAAHIADFSVLPAYVMEGEGNPESAFFAAQCTPPPFIPEPASTGILAVSALALLRRKKS